MRIFSKSNHIMLCVGLIVPIIEAHSITNSNLLTNSNPRKQNTSAPTSTSPSRSNLATDDEGVRMERSASDLVNQVKGNSSQGINPISNEDLVDLLIDSDRFVNDWSPLGDGCKAEYNDAGAFYYRLHYKNIRGENRTKHFGKRNTVQISTLGTIFTLPTRFTISFSDIARKNAENEMADHFKKIVNNQNRWPCGAPQMVSKRYTPNGLVGKNLINYFVKRNGELACDADLGDRIRKPNTCYATPVRTDLPSKACEMLFKIARSSSSSFDSNTELKPYPAEKPNFSAFGLIKSQNIRAHLLYKSLRMPFGEDFIDPDLLNILTDDDEGSILHTISQDRIDIADLDPTLLASLMSIMAASERARNDSTLVQFSDDFRNSVISRMQPIWDSYKNIADNSSVPHPVYSMPKKSDVDSHNLSILSPALSQIFGTNLDFKLDCPKLPIIRFPSIISVLSTSKSDLASRLNLKGVQINTSILTNMNLSSIPNLNFDREEYLAINPGIININPGFTNLIPNGGLVPTNPIPTDLNNPLSDRNLNNSQIMQTNNINTLSR